MLKRLLYGDIIKRYEEGVAEEVRKYYENLRENPPKDKGVQSNEYR